MIERYSLPEMAAIWSEANKLAVWKEVETLVVEAWADLGVGSIEAAAALRAAPEVQIGPWKEREAVTNHDVAAFVDLLAESVDVDHTHRIRGPDGTVYCVVGSSRDERIDALLEINAIRTS